MISVMIVDDEIKVCQLINKLIRWEELGLELIGMYTDGKTAMEKIYKYQPDIVLADIRMPGYTGLDLGRISKEHGLDTEFVIISGYRQFEYAQCAVHIGVADYILKPIDENELNDTVLSVADRIREKRNSDKLLRDAQDMMSNERRLFVMELWDHITRNRPMPDCSEQQMRLRCGVAFDKACYRMVCIETNTVNLNDRNPLFLSNVQKIIEKTSDEDDVEIFGFGLPSGCFFLLNSNSHTLTEEELKQEQLTREISVLRDIYGKFSFHIGISSESATSEDMIKLMDEALMAVIRGKGYTEHRIEWYCQEDNVVPDEDTCEILAQSIRSLDSEKLSGFFDRIISMKDAVSPCGLLCMWRKGIRELARIREDSGLGEVDGERLIQAIIDSDSTWDILQKIKDYVVFDVNAIMAESDAKEVLPVRNAKRFIDENYGRQITLEEIAKYVQLSPAYLSSIFKKYSGQGLVEYINHVRIKQAEKLLRTSAKNIGEIAWEVGYNDEKYFSKTFRRQVGIKPTEYRKLYAK